MDKLTPIAENLRQARERLAEAALRAGRAPTNVQLIAVSKTHPPAAVMAAWEAGQQDFGENRPEEGAEKIPQVRAWGATPRWHSIGPIQRRKAGLVVAYFDYVHAVERLTVAAKLSALAQAAGRELPVLLECNVSGEATKHGYALAGWEHDLELRTRFFAEVTTLLALPALRVEGLMTLAPISDAPETVRPVFASLRALRDALREQFPQLPWAQLSMGMSDDFEVAVEEGATLVRIGRAIFGQR